MSWLLIVLCVDLANEIHDLGHQRRKLVVGVDVEYVL